MHLSSTQVKKISFVIIIFWNKNVVETKSFIWNQKYQNFTAAVAALHPADPFLTLLYFYPNCIYNS